MIPPIVRAVTLVTFVAQGASAALSFLTPASRAFARITALPCMALTLSASGLITIVVSATLLLVSFRQPGFLRLLVAAVLDYVPNFLASQTGTSFGMCFDYFALKLVLAVASA